MSDDLESLFQTWRSDTAWVPGKKGFTTKLGLNFCLIIYTLQNRDVLGLSLHTSFSMYDKRCRGYQMVSKSCGTLVIEEGLSTQLKSFDRQKSDESLSSLNQKWGKSKENWLEEEKRKNILAHVMEKSRDIWIWLWAQLYSSHTWCQQDSPPLYFL